MGITVIKYYLVAILNEVMQFSPLQCLSSLSCAFLALLLTSSTACASALAVLFRSCSMLSSLDNLSVRDAVYFVATLLRRSNLCKTLF